MNQYLRNIIQRLQQYSLELDKKEVFIDKPWVFLDEKNNTHEYLFMRDSRLIMSLNGTVTEGKWELLPNGKLLINRVVDKVMLQNMFIDDALMVLHKSGSDDDSFVLINQKVIPDLDALKYLVDKEEKKMLLDTQDSNTIRVLRSGLISGLTFFEGNKVESFNGDIVTGIFRTTNKKLDTYVVVENSIIKETFAHFHYLFRNQDVLIKQASLFNLRERDSILNLSSIKIDKSNKLLITDSSNSTYSIKINEDGVVLSVTDTKLQLLFIVLSVLIIIIFFIVMISIYS